MAAKDRYREQYKPHSSLFRKGNMVEVSSNEEGFKGAWYVATIVKTPVFRKKSKLKPKVLVQHNNLISDDDENVLLTESVDPSFVRPIPPVSGITDKTFEEYDVVDVFHNDGWWKGVVRSVKVIDEVKRYSVLFETVNPPRELEFGPNDLRFHCEWIKGEWVHTPNQKYTSSVHGQTEMRDGSENQLEQSSPGDGKSMTKREEKRTPTKLEEPLVCLSKKFKKDKSTNEGWQATQMQIELTNQRVQVTDNAITKCTTQLLAATNPLDGFEAAWMRRNMESTHAKPSYGFEATLRRKMLDENEDPTEKVEWAKGRVSSQDSSAASVIGRIVSHAENSCPLDQYVNKQRNGDESEQQKGKKHNQVGDGARPEELPFVKRSPIWKHVESLEAFRLTPQKPHFRPLIDQQVVRREGLAIGHMLTFANIVENTTKLQVNDPRDTFDSYIEVLAELEVLGFDIKLVMDRLNQLLSLKDKREHLQHQAKDFDSQIELRARKIAKLREDIDRIHKLKSQLEEEMAMKMSMNVTLESDLISLQVVAKEIKEGLSSSKHEFESLAASSW